MPRGRTPLAKAILTKAIRRGSGFDEMGKVSSLGAFKPTPIGSAAVFLDLVISCPNTARMIASSVG
jgi:hypothetical protein